MTDHPTPQPTDTFAAFWIFRAASDRHARAETERAEACRAALGALADHEESVRLRGAYSTTGLTAGADLILWMVADDLADLQCLGAALHRASFGALVELRHTYLGMASASQYDPNHGPAFLRGVAPKRYLSVYPFTKTPSWYLLPFEQRRSLMAEHGRMGHEFPSILTNTVSSFGIADQEFVVALEDDDPATLIRMVQRLRAAAVREYTQVDTPIFLGLRKEPELALRDALL
jgi:chlorite dismutase